MWGIASRELASQNPRGPKLAGELQSFRSALAILKKEFECKYLGNETLLKKRAMVIMEYLDISSGFMS
jgi:hypothetical protein